MAYLALDRALPASWIDEVFQAHRQRQYPRELLFSSIALIFNALAKGYDFITYYFTLVLTPMMFLSGVFFPREQLPPIVRAISDWLPLTNAVELVRPLFMDQWPAHPLRHGLVLVVTTVVAFWVALALTRKRFKA